MCGVLAIVYPLPTVFLIVEVIVIFVIVASLCGSP